MQSEIPRILLCQMVRCGFVSQICSHMLGLKDVHKDLAEMKRKISFIALLLPRDRSFQKPNPAYDMGLRGLAWLGHVQGAGSAVQCPRPSIHRSPEEKQIETIKKLRGRAWRETRRTLLLSSSSSTITRLAMPSSHRKSLSANWIAVIVTIIDVVTHSLESGANHATVAFVHFYDGFPIRQCLFDAVQIQGGKKAEPLVGWWTPRPEGSL